MTRVDVISFPYMHDRDDRWYFGMPGKFLRVLDLKLGNDHGELLLTVESEQPGDCYRAIQAPCKGD